MRKPLIDLEPGTRFALPDSQVTGLLVTVSDSRALVRLDRPAEDVEFTDPDGHVRSFRATKIKETSWSPHVVVIVLPNPLGNAEAPMTTATKAPKKARTPRGRKPAAAVAAPRTRKAPAEPKAKKGKAPADKLSQLDAAALVLKEARTPMNCADMIAAMATKRYWVSPGGKTPAATLYAAIGREIEHKGAESRFKKVDKGTFALR